MFSFTKVMSVVLLVVAVSVTLAAGSAQAAWDPIPGPVVQWSGNGHYYQFIDYWDAGSYLNWPLWYEAKAAAYGMSYNGLQGYLLTYTSEAEKEFVRQNVLPDYPAPHEGQASWLIAVGGQKDDTGWHWQSTRELWGGGTVDVEPWGVTDWYPGVPPEGLGNATMYYQYLGAPGCPRGWAGAPSGIYVYHYVWGMIVEYSEPIPEPGSLMVLGSGIVGLVAVRARRIGRR